MQLLLAVSVRSRRSAWLLQSPRCAPAEDLCSVVLKAEQVREMDHRWLPLVHVNLMVHCAIRVVNCISRCGIGASC